MAAKMIIEPGVVEELILDVIQDIQVRKKRANSISVCKSLLKTCGLDDSTTSLQLAMMLAEGKIEDTRTGGSESFRVCESDKTEKQKEKLETFLVMRRDSLNVEMNSCLLLPLPNLRERRHCTSQMQRKFFPLKKMMHIFKTKMKRWKETMESTNVSKD